MSRDAVKRMSRDAIYKFVTVILDRWLDRREPAGKSALYKKNLSTRGSAII
jgi:hypothetical protein